MSANINGTYLENEIKLKPNIYYHLVVTFNNKFKLYVNGFENILENVDLKLNQLYVGLSQENLENGFYGIIGDIKIYNNELAREEICESYNMCIEKNQIN